MTIQLDERQIDQLSTRLALRMWNNHIIKCCTIFSNNKWKKDSSSIFDRLREIDTYDYNAINITPYVLQQYLNNFSIIDHLMSNKPEMMDSYMQGVHCPTSVLQAMYDITVNALDSVNNQYDKLYPLIRHSLHL